MSGVEVVTDIEYSQIEPYLSLSPLDPSVAEALGMLCGFLCADEQDPTRSWLDQLMPLSESDGAALHEAREALRDLASSVGAAVSDEGRVFEMPLPADSAPLVERATAVYDWVRGFLFAMGVLGISEQDLSEDGREVFRDFADLTRMDLDALDESEENEQALMEIAEFARVAALVLKEERGRSQAKMRH